MRRFNFIIPAELDEYLRVASAISGISKGEFLRELIENKMKDDKRFKNFNEIYDVKEEEFDRCSDS